MPRRRRCSGQFGIRRQGEVVTSGNLDAKLKVCGSIDPSVDQFSAELGLTGNAKLFDLMHANLDIGTGLALSAEKGVSGQAKACVGVTISAQDIFNKIFPGQSLVNNAITAMGADFDAQMCLYPALWPSGPTFGCSSDSEKSYPVGFWLVTDATHGVPGFGITGSVQMYIGVGVDGWTWSTNEIACMARTTVGATISTYFGGTGKNQPFSNVPGTGSCGGGLINQRSPNANEVFSKCALPQGCALVIRPVVGVYDIAPFAPFATSASSASSASSVSLYGACF